MIGVVNDIFCQIVDISVEGLTLQCDALSQGQIFSIIIFSIFCSKQRMRAVCEVVRVDEVKAYARFINPSLRLMRHIVSHLGDVYGVEPYYLKR